MNGSPNAGLVLIKTAFADVPGPAASRSQMRLSPKAQLDLCKIPVKSTCKDQNIENGCGSLQEAGDFQFGPGKPVYLLVICRGTPVNGIQINMDGRGNMRTSKSKSMPACHSSTSIYSIT